MPVFAEDKLPVSSVSASSYSGSHTASGAIDNDFVTAWKGDPKHDNSGDTILNYL